METSHLLPHPQTLKTSKENPQENTPPSKSSLPLTSLTLSLSHPFPTNQFSALPPRIKIPSQILSLARSSSSSSLKSSPIRPSNPSSTPSLHSSPSHFLRRSPSDPSASAARRCAIVYLRCDLRVHDNEALAAASHDSLSLLPVYVFDPRDYGKSSSGFDKTGPYRATFILQSVSDLRRSLRERGSDLVVRIGRPESVLVELARAAGADAVYAHREVSHEEVRTEERVEEAMVREGVEVRWFWGSTLYHVDDLGFELQNMPANYGGFRERVEGLSVRRSVEALGEIKGLPSRGDVDPGEIPTLLDLGLGSVPSASLVCAVNPNLTFFFVVVEE